MYSLSLDTQGTLVGVSVSITATHRSKIHRARWNLCHVVTRGLPENKTLYYNNILFSQEVLSFTGSLNDSHKI